MGGEFIMSFLNGRISLSPRDQETTKRISLSPRDQEKIFWWRGDLLITKRPGVHKEILLVTTRPGGHKENLLVTLRPRVSLYLLGQRCTYMDPGPDSLVSITENPAKFPPGKVSGHILQNSNCMKIHLLATSWAE